VTNDSGPAHFASVTEMPTIVLFGPDPADLYGSLGYTEAISAGLACSPCVSAANHRKTACRDPICMRAISPERVFGSVCAVLDEREVLVGQAH
jgi:ADP-heptose:LPS heptosyltransferase